MQESRCGGGFAIPSHGPNSLWFWRMTAEALRGRQRLTRVSPARIPPEKNFDATTPTEELKQIVQTISLASRHASEHQSGLTSEVKDARPRRLAVLTVIAARAFPVIESVETVYARSDYAGRRRVTSKSRSPIIGSFLRRFPLPVPTGAATEFKLNR